MQTDTLDLSADIIDVRDIIARVQALEESQADHVADPDGGHWSDEEQQELAALVAILDDLKGYGGDEEWRGDWYPVTLIADSHFTEYVRDLLEDCGTIPRDLPWFVEVDWNATARNVRMDYTSVDIDGATYWYR